MRSWQERLKNADLSAIVSDLQHQLRLKARHEGNVAKGDRFALHQDENVLSAQALAKVSRHQCMCPER